MKTIKEHWWHSDKKYWSFPDKDEILEKIFKIFEGEEIYLNSALHTGFSNAVITKAESPKLSQIYYTSRITQHHNFEDLRRELVSRGTVQVVWCLSV
ncbi:MAG: hypothetical protein AB1422_16435 [bacterium]